MSIATRRMQRSAKRTDFTPPPPQVAGAVPLGTANYDIPSSNVIYLATNGNDSNAGTSISAPKATLISALAAVPSGGTIVVRAGEYRQSQPNVILKSFTLQNYPGEVVWFDGSDPLGDWTFDATTGLWWAPSLTQWSRDDPEGLAGDWNPQAVWRDMLFRDSNPLWLVSSNPTTGQFMADYTSNRIWVADDPTGRDMRITTRDRFLLLNAANITVRGIGVRRFTTPTWGGGIQCANSCPDARFENIHMHDCSSLSSSSDTTTVNHCTMIRSQQMAIGATRGTDCEWSNNLIIEANWKLIQYHTNSALKVTWQTRPRIVHNIIRSPYRGMAIWLDISCYQPVVVGNLIEDSQHNGIFVELTEHGIIANNYIYGSGVGFKSLYALTSYNSGSQQYWNNYVENFTEYLIHIGGDNRRNAVSQESGDGISWELIPWYAQHISILNNILGPNAKYFQIGGAPAGCDMANVFDTVSGNLSYGNSAGGTEHTALFRWYDGTVNTILKNWTALDVAHPGFGFAVNALTATVHPTAAEAAALAPSIGVPLTAEVAAALGVPVGLKAIGPILPKPIEV